MDTLVSIIIPSHNRAGLLRRAVESVWAQQYPHYELLIVDDRSTDTTAEMVTRLSAKDPRIRYLRNVHPRGPAGARNFGIEHARGSYYAFLDSDDVWLPGHLVRAVALFESRKKIGLYFGNKVLVDQQQGTRTDFFRATGVVDDLMDEPIGDQIYQVTCGILGASTRAYPGVMPATVVRGAVLGDVRFREDLTLAEDLDYFLRCHLTHRTAFAFCLSPSVEVYRHGHNISALTPATDLEYCRNHIKLFQGYLDAYDIDVDETQAVIDFLRLEQRRLIYYLRLTGRYREAYKAIRELRRGTSMSVVGSELIKTLLAPICRKRWKES